MPSIKSPRKGSMQFWPRKRAKRVYARVRAWAGKKDSKPLGFIGYKAGMTHTIGVNENKNSHLKGEEMFVPMTILECPPMKIYSARFYKKTGLDTQVSKEVFFKTEKDFLRKAKPAKDSSKELASINAEDYHDILITVYTQPSKMGFGKKKPEIIELGLGGSKEDKLAYIKEHFEKEISVADVFGENDLIDIHAITKGKGTQGPVRRFGIGIRHHKSEKSIRNPGSLGPWIRQQHISWRVSHAGQMGFHQRTEHNKQILKITDNLDLAPKNIHKYGDVKSTFITIYGSVAGPKKRPVILTNPIRAKTKKHQLALQ
jgi:large subunit ribosomal protein L3